MCNKIFNEAAYAVKESLDVCTDTLANISILDPTVRIKYSEQDLFNATYILKNILLSKMWELQQEENMALEHRLDMAAKLVEDMRKLIKTYTNIDTHEISFEKV